MTYLAFGFIAAIISVAFIAGFSINDARTTCQLQHSSDYCYTELKP